MLGHSRHLNALEARRLRRIRLFAATAMIAIALLLGVYLGQRIAYSELNVDFAGHSDPAPLSAAQLAEPLVPMASEQIAELKRELDMRVTRHEIDRQALEIVRGEILVQKEQIADLAEGLNFYQSLMAPTKVSQGLSLRPVELVLLEPPGRFSFLIVAQQEALKHTLLKGQLSVEVIGAIDGVPTSHSLADLSESVETNPVELRFRYFQAIQGELNLPRGFVPERIDMVASAKKPRKMEVAESYPWRLKERFTYVGN